MRSGPASALSTIWRQCRKRANYDKSLEEEGQFIWQLIGLGMLCPSTKLLFVTQCSNRLRQMKTQRLMAALLPDEKCHVQGGKEKFLTWGGKVSG